MALSPGTKLGPYQILAPIGAGGMGAVYRAHDSRLNRDVAIKVSNAQFTDRFTREARSIAALNHTNICHLYDVGPDYLVIEYVEGEDLRGPLGFDDALPVIEQLIDGIEAAHEKNIVHRDLKPANIKITPEGVVKILDFGLAKAMEPPPSHDGNVENSPTLTIGGTQADAILGTAAYMAPEQAKGKPADRRSDIWSFGVIVYELLTGKRLYHGESAVEILGAVLNREPDMSAAPARAQKLLRRCLEKDRKQRLQAIGDARRMLREPEGAQSPPPSRSRFGSAGGLAAGVLAALLAIALWAPWRSEKQVSYPLLRLDVDLGADVSLPSLEIPTGTNFAISPDETRLVYASGTPTKLFLRRLDQPKAAALPGTEGEVGPFFSPDGQWIGFWVNGKLNKISVEGGAAIPLGVTGAFFGAEWAEDGSILVSDGLGKGLLRIPAAGGAPERIAEVGKGQLFLFVPQLLPGGKAVLFSAFAARTGNAGGYTIEAITLADRHRKVVATGGASPRYVAAPGAPGHLIYVNKATMFAIPFDPEKLETHGTAVPVLDDVAYDSVSETGQFDFVPAPNGHGTLVYRRAGSGASRTTTLYWVDPTGKKEPLPARPGLYDHPSLSPDGRRVALQVFEEQSGDVWVYDPQRDAMTRLTFGGAIFDDPIWSPDGKYVVFTSYGHGMFQARADGAGQPKALIESGANPLPWSFAPDGKWLAYADPEAGKLQIWTVPLEEQGGQLKAGKPEQFLKSGFSDGFPAFSPDGRWLAYQSNESGKDEVYVRAFRPPAAGQGEKSQISNNGGVAPRWSRNGHDLLYRSGDQIMAASYSVKGDTFVAEKPRVWISKLDGIEWDLAPDGKRALALHQGESADAPKPDHELVFLQNFLDYLRQKAPLK